MDKALLETQLEAGQDASATYSAELNELQLVYAGSGCGDVMWA